MVQHFVSAVVATLSQFNVSPLPNDPPPIFSQEKSLEARTKNYNYSLLEIEETTA